MSDHNVQHGGWLVPVRTDLDGTRMIICYRDTEIGTPTDGWVVWCSACRDAVSGVLPGTEGLPDIDGLPDDLADALYRQEARIASEHEAAMTTQPKPVTGSTVRASR